MKRLSTLHTVLNTLGLLVIIQGVLLLLPLLFVIIYKETNMWRVFLIPSLACIVTGFILKKAFKPGRIFFLQSMLICGCAWIVLATFACLPFFIGSDKSFIDSYFETVSGLTTTGITIYTEIGVLSKSLLFWRSFIQWLGGLGILTLFLAITFKSNNAYFQLFAAESHKIDSARPTPSIFKTAVILWSLYGSFTLLEMIVLKLLGLSLFDAVCHSLTTLSTGGFSPYDASIDYYRQIGHPNYKAIEYAITFFMLLGGINFLIHYKIIVGRFKDVYRNTELRCFLFIIVICVLFILFNHYKSVSFSSSDNLESNFRHTIFTVVSIVTTTGYGTTDINDAFFPAMSKQIILILMLIGGSVGSTAGGIKVLRIVVLFRLFKVQIKRLWLPRKALSEVVIDKKIFPNAEIKRITGLFFGWLFLILVGGFITAFFTNLNSWQSLSGMFSALGNIGPCFFSVKEMSALPDVVKLTYIFGMLAGRLEILPVLLIFSRRAWKN